jgi:hypothetical protein
MITRLKPNETMIGKAANFFWVTAVLAAAVWILGFVAGAISSPFDVGIGKLLLSASSLGEVLMYACGAVAWILSWIDPNRKREFTGFSGGRRYGNTPPAMPSKDRSHH